jgi:hypothetical protein
LHRQKGKKPQMRGFLGTLRERLGALYLAEREGFEPPLGCPKPDFESGAFDHSAISPRTADYTGFAYSAARRSAGRSIDRLK